MPKKVASTIANILRNNMMQRILDRESDPVAISSEVLEWWSANLTSRRPAPAYIKVGTFSGTDLDFASVLSSLANRKAVAILPSYQGMRSGAALKEGQVLVSPENRHGKVLRLQASKDTFAFSLVLEDSNVVTTDTIGDLRTFAVTDLEGNWHKGWKEIQILPNDSEKEFFAKNNLLVDQSVTFQYFVTPSKWRSFYGQYYIMTKALLQRLEEEAQWCKDVIKYLESSGPRRINGTFREDTGDNIPIKISAFESLLFIPEILPHPVTLQGFKGRSRSEFKRLKVIKSNFFYETPFDEYFDRKVRAIEKSKTPWFNLKPSAPCALTRAKDQHKVIKSTLLPKLQLATRLVELAFCKYGMEERKEKVPHWFQEVKWVKDYCIPGKRKKWDRLVLFQPTVGKLGVSLLKRHYEKTERVSKKYKEISEPVETRRLTLI